MATVDKTDMTEAELLHFYLGLRLQKGDRKVPVAQILADFPKYLQQLESVRAKLHEAEKASAAGRSGAIDWEAFEERLKRRLIEAGVPE